MSRDVEIQTKEQILQLIGNYRDSLPESTSLQDVIKIQVTYWMEDVISVMYHDDKYNIEDLYGSDIFDSALILKVYKMLRDLHVTYMGWNFDITNSAIDEAGMYIFNNLAKTLED